MNPQPSVNGVTIPEAAIAAEMQNHPAASPDAAWAEAARALAVRELLLQEARRQGLETAEPADDDDRRLTDEDALIDRLLDAAIDIPEADEESCRRYYENNLRRFRSPDLFEASHILLSAAPEQRLAYDDAVRDAEVMIATLQQRPELFADLAKARSACPSAAVGGSLGQIGRGQTVPEFETFLFALEPGQLCPVPVKTRYGVHMLRLDRRIEGRQLPFEAVRDRVADYLRTACWQRAVSQYLTILAGENTVEGIDLVGPDGPLRTQ